MRKVLLSTPRFSVEHREYPGSDGATVRRELVVHPGAVVILPVLDAERIVMIRNYRYTVEEELLELPAGTREPNESPIETAARELVEETGYRASRLEPLTEFYTSPGILSERMFAFVALDLVEVGARPEETERITVQITAIAEARRMVIEGRLRDGKTIAVLSTYLARLDARK